MNTTVLGHPPPSIMRQVQKKWLTAIQKQGQEEWHVFGVIIFTQQRSSIAQ